MTTFRTHIERNVQLEPKQVMMLRVGLGYSNEDPTPANNWRLIMELGIQPEDGEPPPDEFAIYALSTAQARTLISSLQYQLGELDRRAQRNDDRS